jgi:hypothetical protein
MATGEIRSWGIAVREGLGRSCESGNVSDMGRVVADFKLKWERKSWGFRPGLEKIANIYTGSKNELASKYD